MKTKRSGLFLGFFTAWQDFTMFVLWCLLVVGFFVLMAFDDFPGMMEAMVAASLVPLMFGMLFGFLGIGATGDDRWIVKCRNIFVCAGIIMLVVPPLAMIPYRQMKQEERLKYEQSYACGENCLCEDINPLYVADYENDPIAGFWR